MIRAKLSFADAEYFPFLYYIENIDMIKQKHHV